MKHPALSSAAFRLFTVRLTSLALAGALVLAPFSHGGRALAENAAPVTAAGGQGLVAANGMVVAQEALAARIGVDILQRGGNAVDAAVAVGFAMAVTYPRAGNIGGGGFMVIHRADGKDTTIDYREIAPAAIDENPFSTQTATPIRRSRATPRSPSGCRVPSPASRWRKRNTALAVSRWPT